MIIIISKKLYEYIIIFKKGVGGWDLDERCRRVGGMKGNGGRGSWGKWYEVWEKCLGYEGCGCEINPEGGSNEPAC